MVRGCERPVPVHHRCLTERSAPPNEFSIRLHDRDLRAVDRDELLAQVFEGGPAYRACIRTGDIPISINEYTEVVSKP